MQSFKHFFLEDDGDKQGLLVIYPGRFHPFHKGHKSIYDSLVLKFPEADVRIVTSDKIDPPKSPFTFDEKVLMMQLAGVKGDQINKERNPYTPFTLMGDYNSKDTKFIAAISEKDMEGPVPRFNYTKKDGSPAYFQPLNGQPIDRLQDMDKHGYIMTLPTKTFSVLGVTIKSASQIRDMYASATKADRKTIIEELYNGNYDERIFNLFNSKLSNP